MSFKIWGSTHLQISGLMVVIFSAILWVGTLIIFREYLEYAIFPLAVITAPFLPAAIYSLRKKGVSERHRGFIICLCSNVLGTFVILGFGLFILSFLG